jgi:hypothetical protein
MALAGMQLILNPPAALVNVQAAPVWVTVTAADADFVESPTEVAFTTPMPALLAVNFPLLSTVPTDPVAVQVTPAVDPVTWAVNCCFPPTPTLAVTGVMLTEIPPPPPLDVTVTCAVADFVVSSTEVAVTVPVPAETAVNKPF